jgi:outer membrane lipoprotein-sorting protein
MKAATRGAVLALFVCAARGLSQPDAAEILKRVTETYKSATEYELVMDTTYTDAAGAAQAPPFPARLAFKSPDRYRIEGIPTLLYPGEKMDLIYDSSTLWMYLPKSNRYASARSDQLTPNDRTIGAFQPVFDDAGEARVLREESIAAGGDAAVECYVVHFQMSGATVWVDKRRFYILREDSATSSTTFKTVKLNEPISDDLFKFVPPEGATKIEFPR